MQLRLHRIAEWLDQEVPVGSPAGGVFVALGTDGLPAPPVKYARLGTPVATSIAIRACNGAQQQQHGGCARY